MPKVNIQVLNKYNSYSNVQLVKEFLTDARNDGQMVTASSFVPDVMGNFLGKMSADDKTFLYSRVKKSVDLIQAIYDLYMDNFQYCDFALNLEALTKVLVDFVSTNTRALPVVKLRESFENFFTPILHNAYTFRNNNQIML